MHNIYQAVPADIPKIVDTVVSAFWDYPVWAYFFPKEEPRTKGLAITAEFILNHAFKRGIVLCESKECQAIAVWLPSEHVRRSLFEEIRYGGIGLAWGNGLTATIRMMQVANFDTDLEFELVKEPHHYLAFLGVRSGNQGQGLGHRLLTQSQYFLNEPRPYYLETHNPKSLDFYKRNGFRVLAEGILPRTNIRYWSCLHPGNQS